MIAVVTSTIKPLTVPGQSAKSYFSFPERLEQTKATLAALQQHGFSEVFLIDNSPGLNQTEIEILFNGYVNLKIFHIEQYQFINKGINELLMLLYICSHLPADTEILKISGRYKPTASFQKPNFNGFAFKGYNFESRKGTISTRAYWVKDTATYQEFLLNCQREVFAYPERIVNYKSLVKKLYNFILSKPVGALNISIEFAAANVLKQGKPNFTLLNNLGIEGLVAGSSFLDQINE